jgi:hypothetical protein
MSNELKHADVIIHMAKHDFDSVEGRRDARYDFADADADCNPTTSPSFEWRIKPSTITYTVTLEPPMRVMPKNRDKYWIMDVYGAYSMTCDLSEFDEKMLAAGNMWDTEDKARAAWHALFGPLKAKE